MTDKESLLYELSVKEITAILIGGLALRMYNSPRVTHDMDLAIRILDVDKVIKLMYQLDYYLVSDVRAESAVLQLTVEQAQAWIENSKNGSMTFIRIPKSKKPRDREYPLHLIDINTQVDFLFELSIPIIKLKKNAKVIQFRDFEFLLASKEDLLQLKKNRRDKTASDFADIEFLSDLIDHDLNNM